MMGTTKAQPLPPRPAGDPGLFGPGSMGWQVHGDFPAMMMGGVAALLMQMLHPAALAGVWDHSNFRRDMQGRLRRTAQFIAGTTFGSTAHAHQLIDRVRRIHDRVGGTLPDGTPYQANDPDVLLWVHATGARCFLDAYRRYRAPWLTHGRSGPLFCRNRGGGAGAGQCRAADDAGRHRRLYRGDAPAAVRPMRADPRGDPHPVVAPGTQPVGRAAVGRDDRGGDRPAAAVGGDRCRVSASAHRAVRWCAPAAAAWAWCCAGR